VINEKPFYAPDRGAPRPRQPTPGEEVWRLRHGDHVQSCELRNTPAPGGMSWCARMTNCCSRGAASMNAARGSSRSRSSRTC
jgi:hypothetical protein